MNTEYIKCPDCENVTAYTDTCQSCGEDLTAGIYEVVDGDDDPDFNETDGNILEENLTRDPVQTKMFQEAQNLMTRSRRLLGEVHDEDKEEIINLHEQIEQALGRQDKESLSGSVAELKELLFFIEGK